MMDSMIVWLKDISTAVHLTQFVLIGSFVEEVIAPIPSPFVLTLTGSLAKAQNYDVPGVILLIVLAAISKTLGSWILYILGDKAEDFITGRWGQALGLSHATIEGLGKRFTGRYRDGLIVLLLRAIPAVPSAPVSVLCGAIKMKLRVYLPWTFAGNILRATLFVVLGFTGIGAFEQVVHGLEKAESYLTLAIGVALLIVIGLCYRYRHSGALNKWLS